MEAIRQWFRRAVSDPQIVTLALLLAMLLVIVVYFGDILAPVLASVAIAYLLDGIVVRLTRVGIPRWASVLVVFFAFVALVILLMFGVLPLLIRQITDLIQQLPEFLDRAQTLVLQLPERYPQLITEQQATEMVQGLGQDLSTFLQDLVKNMLGSLVNVIGLMVFLVLIPVLVFFMLKDKAQLMAWWTGNLPKDRRLASSVWHEVDFQIGNYLRGKAAEILIIWFVSYLTFQFFGLQYAFLLGALVGVSVLIPYIGATVVTIPVAIVAYTQWGFSAEFGFLLAAYLVIQILDGNVLVPYIFAEANNLHPVAIIVALLFFGGIWGFWGVFFAIPLATVVQALIHAWRSRQGNENESAGADPAADAGASDVSDSAGDDAAQSASEA